MPTFSRPSRSSISIYDLFFGQSLSYHFVMTLEKGYQACASRALSLEMTRELARRHFQTFRRVRRERIEWNIHGRGWGAFEFYQQACSMVLQMWIYQAMGPHSCTSVDGFVSCIRSCLKASVGALIFWNSSADFLIRLPSSSSRVCRHKMSRVSTGSEQLRRMVAVFPIFALKFARLMPDRPLLSRPPPPTHPTS